MLSFFKTKLSYKPKHSWKVGSEGFKHKILLSLWGFGIWKAMKIALGLETSVGDMIPNFTTSQFPH